MSGTHPGSDRVDQAMLRLGHWREGPVAEVPWDDLRAEVLEVDLAAYLAGLAQPTEEQSNALSGALQRAQRAEARLREVLEANGWLALQLLGTVSPGAIAIAQERQRQLDVEGYSAEHDAAIPAHELVRAGVAYALSAIAPDPDRVSARAYWPWGQEHFKPRDPERDLDRAGALIAAGRDRLPGTRPVAVRPRSIGAMALPFRGEIG